MLGVRCYSFVVCCGLLGAACKVVFFRHVESDLMVEAMEAYSFAAIVGNVPQVQAGSKNCCRSISYLCDLLGVLALFALESGIALPNDLV